jgi:hypothetical protein
LRRVATYAFKAPANADGIRADLIATKIEAWLSSKGVRDSPSEGKLELRDGRIATVRRESINSAEGQLFEVELTEPLPEGTFRTTIRFSEDASSVAVGIGLSAASDSLSPIFVDVRCPQIIRDLLEISSHWSYRDSRLSAEVQRFRGEHGGGEFIRLVWAEERSVPVVAISDIEGLVLHPDIDSRLARDLAGIALVARLDHGASWYVTRQKGREWSCYGGALRLYWPNLSRSTSQYQHPLWTPARLLSGVPDTRSAADRITRQIRRKIFAQSAFALAEPAAFEQIRRAARREELEQLRAKATPDADYKALAEEYFEAATSATEELESKNEEIAQLREQVESLQMALRYQESQSDVSDVAPDSEVPPSTVAEAVEAARLRHHDLLRFGSDVPKGISGLAADAGPPGKILDYLSALAALASALREGDLGASVVDWLKRNSGVNASGESETIRNSPKAQRARTWDDGEGCKRAFNLHLKPAEGTSPDRCVRIYFDYEVDRGLVMVGWVGRHL